MVQLVDESSPFEMACQAQYSICFFTETFTIIESPAVLYILLQMDLVCGTFINQ